MWPTPQSWLAAFWPSGSASAASRSTVGTGSTWGREQRRGILASVADRRTLPVPEGLDGLRLDAAIARLFGVSRTTAAALVDAGEASVDGVVRARSDRVVGGAWLDVGTSGLMVVAKSERAYRVLKDGFR